MPMDGKKGFQKVKGSLRGQEMETGISHQVRSQTAKIQRDNPELHKRILNGEVLLADIRKQEKIAKRKATIACHQA